MRLSWHLWPGSAAEADAMAAPLGLLYSPLRPIPKLKQVDHAPVQCSQCSGVLSPFAHVEPAARRWLCPHCGHWNALPNTIAEARSMPTELQPEHATLEYTLPDASTGTTALTLVLDCSLPAEELAHLQKTVQAVLDALPADPPVALITCAACPPI